jgi:hypothetical protein
VGGLGIDNSKSDRHEEQQKSCQEKGFAQAEIC